MILQKYSCELPVKEGETAATIVLPILGEFIYSQLVVKSVVLSQNTLTQCQFTQCQLMASYRYRPRCY